MIYLIGGPPKCGKTTLAKKLSISSGIPWVSTDTLQNVIKPYIGQAEKNKKFPSSAQRCDTNDEKYTTYSTDDIIDAYRRQARTVYDAVDMFILSEISDGNDFIIEGYHLEPAFVHQLEKRYPDQLKHIFLIKTDSSLFVENIKKSTTPNDWIIARTHHDETYTKIAKMICAYGKIFEEESNIYGFDVFNMDEQFDDKIDQAVKYIVS